MSGPKDFAFVFIAERLAEIRLRNQAKRDARAARVQQELALAQRQAKAVHAASDAALKASIQSALDRAAIKTRQELEQAKAASAAPGDLESVTEKTKLQASAREADRSEKVAMLNGWSAALAGDSAVISFAAKDFAQWSSRVEAIKCITEANFSEKADELAIEAQTIHDRAGDIQAQFDTRNELIRDVIESMKEMGYFVSDPYLADPSDPSTPAILKATCGSEVVTTSIDLTSTVKSIWDGQEHEHCKNSFFDFMKSMKSHGVSITPEREDLRERPVLKQQDANELPRSEPGGRQAGT